MIVSAHQPHYLPWLRYFHKIATSDCFVLLDDLQFNKGGFQNRSFIKDPNGKIRLTVPVKHKYKQNLLDVLIISDSSWKAKHWQSIKSCYGNSGFFKYYQDFFQDVYDAQWEKLNSLNEYLLDFFIKTFAIKTKIVKSSELFSENILETATGTDRLIRVVREVGGTSYLAGAYSTKTYLDISKMEKAGIKVVTQNWKPVPHKQQFLQQGFIPDLSIVDLLFNEGDDSLSILLKSGGKTNADSSLMPNN